LNARYAIPASLALEVSECQAAECLGSARRRDLSAALSHSALISSVDDDNGVQMVFLSDPFETLLNLQDALQSALHGNWLGSPQWGRRLSAHERVPQGRRLRGDRKRT